MRGRVQGVFFRAFAERVAKQLGVAGYVRNLPDGTVEVQAEGEKGQLEELLGYLKKGPPHSLVDRVDVSWSEETRDFTDFTIEY